MNLKITKKNFTAEEGLIELHLTPSECEQYGFGVQDCILSLDEAHALRDTIWKCDKCISSNWLEIANIIGEYTRLLPLWRLPYLSMYSEPMVPGDTIHFPAGELKQYLENEIGKSYQPSTQYRKQLEDVILGTDEKGLIVSCWRKHIREKVCLDHAHRKNIGKGRWRPSPELLKVKGIIRSF